MKSNNKLVFALGLLLTVPLAARADVPSPETIYNSLHNEMSVELYSGDNQLIGVSVRQKNNPAGRPSFCRRTSAIVPNPTYNYACFYTALTGKNAEALYAGSNTYELSATFRSATSGGVLVGMSWQEKNLGSAEISLCVKKQPVVPNPVATYTCYSEHGGIGGAVSGRKLMQKMAVIDEGLALRKSLSDAQSYRDFLKRYFQATSISYAEVARRAGFTSRSYPRDVTEGRRRLTSRSLPTLTRGLKLEHRLSELFQLLYFREHPEEYTAKSTLLQRCSVDELRIQLGLKIEQARIRAQRASSLRKNFVGTQEPKMSPRLSEKLIERLFEILASLGSPEKGATLADLKRLTGLEKRELDPILKECIREGLVQVDTKTGRFFPTSGHLNLTGMPKNELVRRIFLRTLDRTKGAAETLYSSEEALFYLSAVSISRSCLPKLKKELRELLLRYSDRLVEDNPDPDTVIYLMASMIEARRAC